MYIEKTKLQNFEMTVEVRLVLGVEKSVVLCWPVLPAPVRLKRAPLLARGSPVSNVTVPAPRLLQLSMLAYFGAK